MRVQIMAVLAGAVLAGNMLAGLARPSFAAVQINKQANEQIQAQIDYLLGETNEESIIPEQSVRLRIIANSDSEADQNLKRQLRDRIIQEVGSRLRGAASQEEARAVLQAAVPELNSIAAAFVKEKGFVYDTKTDYGQVPFPTKMYGDQVYPAGEYEALRIVLGAGEGQNWWCVLFPPLCFIDIANGDAIQAKDMETKPVAAIQVPAADSKAVQTVQVRLGSLDLLRTFVAKISQVFAAIFE